MKTSDVVKNRAQAGRVMYDGRDKAAGDDLWEDETEVTGEKPVKVGVRGTASLNPTMTGIQIVGQITEEEWEEVANNVAESGSALNWLLGDLCLIGSHKKYGAYTRFAEKYKIEQRRMDDLIYVCRNVTYTVRTVGLSFTHHRLVIPFYDENNAAESRETQKHLLSYAAVNGLTVEQFRDYINVLPTTVDATGQVALMTGVDVTNPPAPAIKSFWEKPIDRMERDILKRWDKAKSEEKTEALNRLKLLVKELEKRK